MIKVSLFTTLPSCSWLNSHDTQHTLCWTFNHSFPNIHVFLHELLTCALQGGETEKNDNIAFVNFNCTRFDPNNSLVPMHNNYIYWLFYVLTP